MVDSGSGDFQSEIRQSEVNQLIERVEKLNYRKYLRRVSLAKVRGFTEQTVNFDFPITAVVGPNGGGKTTVLGASALAYRDILPRQFFAKSGAIDKSMVDWRIEFDLVDRDVTQRELIHRSATFLKSKWYRDPLQREIQVFGVSRTVPANERSSLRKYASNTYRIAESGISALDADVARAVQRILGKDVSEYSHIRVDARGKVSLLAGRTDKGSQYSEFHFGAGESSVIRMVMGIEAMADQALILIEEIENGLHPVATTRMVEYLMDVANRKRVQAIFTTHSNDALMPLPPEAIWACIGWEVFRGKLDIHALRTIEGRVDAQLAVYTEDEFAANWIRAMLRAKPDVDLEVVKVYPLKGDGMAVAINSHHNQDPARAFDSVCVLDGDSQQQDNGTSVLRLPGQNPELFVFDQVVDTLSEQEGVLAVALHRRFEDAPAVSKVIRETRLTNHDPHLLYSQVGKRLGLIPEATVRDAFLSVWVQAYHEHTDALLRPILKRAPAYAETVA